MIKTQVKIFITCGREGNFSTAREQKTLAKNNFVDWLRNAQRLDFNTYPAILPPPGCVVAAVTIISWLGRNYASCAGQVLIPCRARGWAWAGLGWAGAVQIRGTTWHRAIAEQCLGG